MSFDLFRLTRGYLFLAPYAKGLHVRTNSRLYRALARVPGLLFLPARIGADTSTWTRVVWAR